jgi:hypothetical protein
MRVAEQGERLGLDQRYSYVPEGACRLLPESDRLPRVVARESQFGQPEQRSGLDQPFTGLDPSSSIMVRRACRYTCSASAVRSQR